MKKLLTILVAVALGLNLSAQVPYYVPSEGLVAWYPFNGNADDASANGNDLELIGEVNWDAVDGMPFGDFPGDGQYMYHPDSNFPEVEELTISIWFRSDSWSWGSGVGTIRPLLSKHLSSSNGSYIFYANSTQIDLRHNFSVPHSWNVGEWHHVVVSWNTEQTAVFIDGDEVYDGDSNLIDFTDHLFLVGGWLNNVPGYGPMALTFDGGIRGLGLWNRQLSSLEVQNLFLESPVIFGCMDELACNFNPDANYTGENCEYPENGYDCDGVCLNDADGDGVCDEFEIVGCQDPLACDYIADATDEGDCDYTCCPGPGCCDTGTTWDYEIEKCVTINPCPEDLNSDGIVGIDDLLELLSSFGMPCDLPFAEWTCGDPVAYHGYDYETVQIGEQCWFAENLQTEHYKNGDGLQDNLSNLEWTNANVGAQCTYENIDENLGLYGRLYNWHAVNDERGVCPANWHIPSQTEWFVLVDYAAPESGLKLKADSLSTPAWNGTDYLGFSATAAGRRDYATGQFLVLNEHAYWWTGTQTSGDRARLMHISSELTAVESLSYFFEHGFSVRCIKDTE